MNPKTPKEITMVKIELTQKQFGQLLGLLMVISLNLNFAKYFTKKPQKLEVLIAAVVANVA